MWVDKWAWSIDSTVMELAMLVKSTKSKIQLIGLGQVTKNNNNKSRINLVHT